MQKLFLQNEGGCRDSVNYEKGKDASAEKTKIIHPSLHLGGRGDGSDVVRNFDTLRDSCAILGVAGALKCFPAPYHRC